MAWSSGISFACGGHQRSHRQFVVDVGVGLPLDLYRSGL